MRRMRGRCQHCVNPRQFDELVACYFDGMAADRSDLNLGS